VIVTPGAARWVLATAIASALGFPVAARASPQETSLPLASPSPSPSASPSPSPRPEAPASLIEKLPTFRDIEDIDLGTLLKVTAGEEGARTADDEPGFVTTISEEDIRRTGARTVQEVLQTVAGIEVLTDGLGRSRIVIRGLASGLTSTSSEGVLVLLNGVRLNDPVTGGAMAVNLDLPVDNVKRIDVVRGPGAAEYGPGALAGVVNIVTEGVDTFRRDEVSLGGGSFKTFLYSYRYGTTYHEVSLAGFMEFAYTGGAELSIPSDAQTARDRALAPFGVPPASLAPGHTDDDRKAVDASLAVAWRRLVFSGRLAKENAGGFVGVLDALGRQDRLASTQGHLAAEYRRRVGKADLRARAFYIEDRLTELADVYPPGFTVVRPSRVVYPGGVVLRDDLDSRQLGADAVLERTLAARHGLTAGARLVRESTFGLTAVTNFDFARQAPLGSFGSVPALVPDARRVVSSFHLQDAWSATGRLSLTGGLRLDHYGGLGARWQPRLSGVYRWRRGLNFKAGYARGTRAPALRELDYTSPAYLANPLLGFETSDTLDAGAILRRRELRVAFTAYRAWLRNLVVPGSPGIPLAGTVPPVLLNLGEADARGLEIEASRTFARDRSLALAYALQDASTAGLGASPARAPTHLGRLSANFPAGRYLVLSPSLSFRSAAERTPVDLRGEVAGYSVVDLVARSRNLRPSLEISAVVHDLFDHGRFDPSPLGGLPGDYPRPGRSVLLRARWRL